MSEKADLTFISGAKGELHNKTSLVEVIDNYLQYYAAAATHTARAKRLDLRCFIDFLAAHHGYSSSKKLKLADWDFSSVQRFIDERLTIGEAPATVSRRLATLKHMGRTLAEKIPGFINPTREVKGPKLNPIKPKGLSSKEIKVIQEKATARKQEKNSFIRIRNQTLFNFLVDTGIRADEVRILRRSQLDEDLEWVKNVRTKGRRYRNVYVTSAVREMLREYLVARDTELKRYFAKLSRSSDSSLPLFISGYGASIDRPESFMLSPKTIWRAINELSTESHLHPHLLRHSFAIELLDHTNDIRLVSQALGHSDVKITMRYTERKDEEIAKALEQARKASGKD